MGATLTARAINGASLHVSDAYISNGHWAIRRDQLAPESAAIVSGTDAQIRAALRARTLRIQRTVTDAQIERAIGGSGDRVPGRVTAYQRITGSKSLPVVGIIATASAAAAVDARYLDFVGWAPGMDVWVSPGGAIASVDGASAIMSARVSLPDAVFTAASAEEV